MLVVTSKLCIEGIEYTRITRNNKAPESGWWWSGVCGVGVRRGFARCVRSNVVGKATRRAARDETGGASGRACAGSYNIQKPNDRQQSRLVLCFVVSSG